MKKTTLLKKLILDDEILVMPGAHDALSAKIIESVGFKVVTMGGYAASAASLAKADVSLLTLTEYVVPRAGPSKVYSCLRPQPLSARRIRIQESALFKVFPS